MFSYFHDNQIVLGLVVRFALIDAGALAKYFAVVDLFNFNVAGARIPILPLKMVANESMTIV